MQGNIIADGILSSAVSEANIVFEAVLEDTCIKNSIFKGMGLQFTCNDIIHHFTLLSSADIASVCPSDTLLCSSTLSLPLEDVFEGVLQKEVSVVESFISASIATYKLNFLHVNFIIYYHAHREHLE